MNSVLHMLYIPDIMLLSPRDDATEQRKNILTLSKGRNVSASEELCARRRAPCDKLSEYIKV